MGTVTRTTKILVALAVMVIVGRIVALWAEWGSAALPDDYTLAARIDESAFADFWEGAPTGRRIVLGGWAFQTVDLFSASARPIPSDSLVHMIMWETTREGRAAFMSATPVSPMAKLKFWLGAYPDDWEPTRP